MTVITRDRLAGARSSLAVKAPCRLATTANITLAGSQTIDGVAVAEGDRILVRLQTDASENGIYEVRLLETTWARAQDWDSTRDVVTGTRVYVQLGDTASGEYYVSTTGTIVVGTTDVTIDAYTNVGSGVTSVNGNTGAVTAAQIKTAYESNSDTNALTDALKGYIDTIAGAASDGQFLVATGSGTITWESSATARASMDVYSTTQVDSAIAAAVTAENLSVSGDSGTGAIDLDSEGLTIAGSGGVTTVMDTNTLTVSAIDWTSSTDDFATSGSVTLSAFNGPLIADSTGGVSGGAWVAHADNPKSSTSGTALTFSSIPSWAQEVRISLAGVSMDGSAQMQVRVGDGTTPSTAGYIGRVTSVTGGGTAYTGGFALTRSANYGASNTAYGDAILNKSSTQNRWNMQASIARGDGGVLWNSGGTYNSTGTADRFSITSTSTAAFDAGTISLFYR